MSMKNSKDNIGNQTRDLPACRAVPQPTAPLRVPQSLNKENKKLVVLISKTAVAVTPNI